MDPKDYLKDVPPENYFRLADGREIRNLDQLLSILKDSGDTVFYEHVTPDRNDFVSWIRECIRYQELCNKLLPIKDRQSFLNVLGQEIDLLKNPKISETMKFFSENYDPKADAKKSETQVIQNSAQENPMSNNASVAPTQSASSSLQSSPVVSSSNGAADLTSELTSGRGVELDFEQILGPIIQEIQEEIFFWQ